MVKLRQKVLLRSTAFSTLLLTGAAPVAAADLGAVNTEVEPQVDSRFATAFGEPDESPTRFFVGGHAGAIWGDGSTDLVLNGSLDSDLLFIGSCWR